MNSNEKDQDSDKDFEDLLNQTQTIWPKSESRSDPYKTREDPPAVSESQAETYVTRKDAGNVSESQAETCVTGKDEGNVSDSQAETCVSGKNPLRPADPDDIRLNPKIIKLKERKPYLKEPLRFPIRNWDRYEPIKLLGQGGMGQVFLAFDPRLRRQVAIKFLTESRPETVKRFLVEARIQAQVTHDRVCKVHEVGEADGKLFIVMQHVQGKPLSEMVGQLNFEEIALVVKQAAEGIQEAHRVGLIHRDIKPGNIMLERTAEGLLHAYVLDFGLACDVEGARMTATGAVLGTPTFMAPEQARGDVKAVDRRADIYGLGATLYFLLSGDYPFKGPVVQVLKDVVENDPPKPSTINPHIPKELEIITRKCMEKEPGRRYASAKALADDLDNWLNGDPINAHPSGIMYRVKRRVIKNKVLSLVVLVAFFLVSGALSVTAYNAWRASQREDLLLDFTLQVQEIEGLKRFSGLSRIHDIRPELADIQRRIELIEQQMVDMGDLAVGPGNYALGRGYTALGDYILAQKHLEAAWDSGFREPRTAYALAWVYSRRYQEVSDSAVTTKEDCDATLAAAEELYIKPALTMLKQSVSASGASPEYIEAQFLWLKKEYDAALKSLKIVQEETPWMYEAFHLEAVIHKERAINFKRLGETEEANLFFKKADSAFLDAAEIGASVPEIYLDRAGMHFLFFSLERYEGGNVDPFFVSSKNALNALKYINPSSLEALSVKCQLYRAMALDKVGTDFQYWSLLQEARDELIATLNEMPENGMILRELGMVYRVMGRVSSNKTTQITYYDQASKLMIKVPDEFRDISFYNNAGLTFLTLGQAKNNDKDLEQALFFLKQGIRLAPKRLSFYTNLGRCYILLSDIKDVNENLSYAFSWLDKGYKINPRNTGLLLYLSRAHQKRFKILSSVGDDGRMDLNFALSYITEAEFVNPNSSVILQEKAINLVDKAILVQQEGQGYDIWFELAKSSLVKAISLKPNDSLCWANYGTLFIDWAQLKYENKESYLSQIQALEGIVASVPGNVVETHEWRNLLSMYEIFMMKTRAAKY